MDPSADADSPGPPTALTDSPGPPTALTVDETWGLKQDDAEPSLLNRESILEELKRKLLAFKQSPVSYLEAKFPDLEAKENTRGPCTRNSHPCPPTLQ